jgi:hypothetical protein
MARPPGTLRRWSLVAGRWSLVAGRWSLDIERWVSNAAMPLITGNHFRCSSGPP